ncbi:BspA family leucine-rich repeat surface protein [Aquiflexum gelatinilyticum]|uniref:BspA family leucine-rich repeat surface protein n=1 Tax=Aquiflexum gelatinilyticum TaxID=2961943 RepID=UPI0021692C6D|nr:BspA family leucine-rich repeat surface protein [Aquiflexum gelatinilyticum]MCS4436610.1 BspA family leucine-rich repeat surface protein [Aquiflexum gelatinilyticum]
MKKTIKLFSLLLPFTMVCMLSCQQEDSDLSIWEGNVRFGGISLEFAPIGTSGNRMEGISPWIHIFPNSANIFFTNKVTNEEYILEYNPNDFSTPYTISLPFGAYEFYTKVEAGIFSDFLPFEAKGEFILNSQSLEISLVGKTDYGLISVKNEFLEESTVSNGNVEADLTICENETHFYKYVKGGTSTTLKIIESTFGGTIIKKINVGANVHYNFVLKRGEGTANIIDLSIDPFELVDEEIIIGSPVFFEENGTIKCPQASPGDKGEVNGKVYEAVDRSLLIIRGNEGADLSCVCTSLVTDMSELVLKITDGEEILDFNQNFSSWDVSRVVTMEKMFYGAEYFNQPIGNWDVSKVTNMERMFGHAYSFNQPIGNWDVSNVINMRTMFSETLSFNQDIGNWDVSNVQNMSAMFGLSNFNRPIGDWDVSNVTDMSAMFAESLFNQPIGNWDVSSVTNMEAMFYDNKNFNQPIGNWNVSKVTSMASMFMSIGAPASPNIFNQPIGNWDVSNVSNLARMFFGSNFNQDLTKWCVQKIATEPDNFSITGSLSESNKPLWGTCPD